MASPPAALPRTLAAVFLLLAATFAGADSRPHDYDAPSRSPARTPAHNWTQTLDLANAQMDNLTVRPDGGRELRTLPGYYGPQWFSVSDYQATQQNPSIAVNSNGTYMVVWEDARNGASNYDIYAQRLDARGQKAGGEITVSNAGEKQFASDIAAAPNGDFIVVWMDYRRNGLSADIYARRLDANGTPVRGDFEVANGGSDDLRNPSIALDTAGNYVVAWEKYSSINSDIYARKYSASDTGGSLVTVAGAAYVEGDPAVAVDSRGYIIVAYENASTGETNISVQRYDSGWNPLGVAVTVTGMQNEQYAPAIAVDSKDNFIVAWQDLRGGTNWDIYAQRFDKDGSKDGAEVTVSTLSFDQSRPAITVDSKDNFTIAWGDYRGGTDSDIYAARFFPNRTRIDDFEVYRGTWTQSGPAVAVDRRDNITIAWSHYTGAPGDIYARRYFHPYNNTGTLVPGPLASPDIWKWTNITADITYGNASVNSVAFDFSTDNGATWKVVASNGSLAAAGAAPSLRIRARMFTTDNSTTPVLYGITVNYITNRVPVVSAGTDLSVWRNAPVTLSARANDDDGDRQAYSWKQVSGPPLAMPNNSSDNISFTPRASGTYRFSVTANDGYNTSAPAFLNVTVTNRLPSATPEAPELRAWKGGTAHLNGGGSDHDGDELSYAWMQVAGNSTYIEPTAERNVSFTAAKAGRFMFSLTVNDSEADSSPAFVNLTVWSRPPTAGLSANVTNTTINGPVLFDGSASVDPDGTVTAYNFRFGDGNESGWQAGATAEHYYAGPGDYAAAVTVRDDDGNETTGAPLTIAVTVTPVVPGNRPPRFTSNATLNTTVGLGYFYNATAFDDDGDPLSFSLLTTIDGMGMTPSGRLTWTPKASQKGNITVKVRVSDGRGGTADQTFTVKVGELPPVSSARPSCAVTAPSAGTAVDGKVAVTGTAVKGGAVLQRVEVRVDGGEWKTASGTDRWGIELDLSGLAPGEHFIEARAYDGTAYSDTARITVTVKGLDGTTGSAPFPWWLAAAALSIALASAGAVFAVRRRKMGAAAGQSLRKPAPATVSHEETRLPAPQPEPKPQAPPPEIRNPEAGMRNEPVTTTPEPAIRNQQSDIPLGPRIVGGDEEDVFRVEQLLLIYRDGRLMASARAPGSGKVDKDIFGAMLTAVQQFVKDSFNDERMNRISFGKKEIHLERGPQMFLASVTVGKVPDTFRRKTRQLVQQIWDDNREVIKHWDGRLGDLAGVEVALRTFLMMA